MKHRLTNGRFVRLCCAWLIVCALCLVPATFALTHPLLSADESGQHDHTHVQPDGNALTAHDASDHEQQLLAHPAPSPWAWVMDTGPRHPTKAQYRAGTARDGPKRPPRPI